MNPKKRLCTSIVIAVFALLAVSMSGCSSSSKASTASSIVSAINSAVSSAAAASTSATTAASTPTPSSPASTSLDLSGKWSGQYSGAASGTFNLDWQQAGGALTGSITISNPQQTLNLTGTLNGTTITFGTVGGFAVTYTGTATATSMSGTYAAVSYTHLRRGGIRSLQAFGLGAGFA